MYRGKIVEEGLAEEVSRQPQHPYTEALLSAVPSVEGPPRERIRLATEPRHGQDAAGCVFAGRCHARVGDVCDREAPPVRRASPTHTFACHREA